MKNEKFNMITKLLYKQETLHTRFTKKELLRLIKIHLCQIYIISSILVTLLLVSIVFNLYLIIFPIRLTFTSKGVKESALQQLEKKFNSSIMNPETPSDLDITDTKSSTRYSFLSSMSLRQQTVAYVCQQHPQASELDVKNLVLYKNKRKILYCPVLKAASTKWLENFILIWEDEAVKQLSFKMKKKSFICFD